MNQTNDIDGSTSDVAVRMHVIDTYPVQTLNNHHEQARCSLQWDAAASLDQTLLVGRPYPVVVMCTCSGATRPGSTVVVRFDDVTEHSLCTIHPRSITFTADSSTHPQQTMSKTVSVTVTDTFGGSHVMITPTCHATGLYLERTSLTSFSIAGQFVQQGQDTAASAPDPICIKPRGLFEMMPEATFKADPEASRGVPDFVDEDALRRYVLLLLLRK